MTDLSSAQNQQIARQGQVSFFSYTSVENIEANNNQVLSIIDYSKSKIAVSMLIRAFVFKKDLMYEHFNESYIESDLYPKANFEGTIIDFDENLASQTKIIKGQLSIHGVTKDIEIKTNIQKNKGNYTLDGEFIKEYPSVREAALHIGVNATSISKVCKGQRKKAGGYIWKYAP